MTFATFKDTVEGQRAGRIVDTMQGVASGATTAAVPASGGVTTGLLFNNLGTTLYSTLKGFPKFSQMAASRDVRLMSLRNANTRELSGWLCRANLIGTLNPNATGQRLTHVATTYPLKRNRRGAARPIRGIPYILITTTTSTTAFALTMDYVNQDGTPVIGTKTYTAPATNAAQGTGGWLPLEKGDVAIQDITALNVSVAAAAGAANIYLMEPIIMASSLLTGHTTETDGLRGSRFVPPSVQPPAPTAGVLDSELVFMYAGGGSTNTALATIEAVEQ